MHRLRDNIDVVDFLNTISGRCAGRVWFGTSQGDEIDLKSELSRYLFLTMCKQDDFLRTGTVRFDEPQDVRTLRQFLI